MRGYYVSTHTNSHRIYEGCRGHFNREIEMKRYVRNDTVIVHNEVKTLSFNQQTQNLKNLKLPWIDEFEKREERER